jgi:hypothetical protein
MCEWDNEIYVNTKEEEEIDQKDGNLTPGKSRHV